MIENGQKVKIHYTGTLDDGTQFDSSAGRDPLEFEMGAGMVIPGFETGVADMAEGEKKSIHIPAAEAYGEVREDLIMNFEKAQLPEDLKPEVGMMLQMQGPEGQPVPVTVKAIEVGDSKRLDFVGITEEPQLAQVGSGEESPAEEAPSSEE